MTAHSKVGASSMYRWSKCPGSVRECSKVPNRESSYAAEGTAAHDLAAKILKRSLGTGDYAPSEDVAEAVQVYVDYVRSLVLKADTLLIEQGFHLKELHPDLYGTADAVVWKPAEKHLHVIDYKHGAGVLVDVNGNPQLRYYALGALLSSGFPATKVTTTIVQPRCPHPDGAIRSETFDAFDLLDWAADLVDAVKRTEDPNAPLNSGDHCRFCPATAVCPAVHERATALAQLEFSPSAAVPCGTQAVPYDAARLKQALDARPMLRAWLTALDEFAYAEAMAGRLPAEVGYKLVEKRANRKWIDEELAAVALRKGGLKDEQIFETPAIKSSAQVEKLVGKKGFKEIEADYVTKESSGFTLVPVDDPRQPVRILDAAAEFTPATQSNFLTED